MKHAIQARSSPARGAPWRASRVVTAIAILFVFVGLLPLAATGQTEPDGQATVDQAVLDAVAADGSADFWVVFRAKADLSAAYGMTDWAARGQYVYERLTETAAASQAGFTAELAARNVAFDSFYVVNAVLVRGADAATLDWARSQGGVERIAARWEVEVPEPTPAEQQARVQALEWNIEMVRANEVWDSFGTRGEGITVANIDTGVDYAHEALVRQYRGNNGDGTFDHNYNWWDPGGDNCADAPCDQHGHGTHTMGSTVGEDDDLENQIGVAPGATWISALGCPFGGCPDFDLIESGEFMIAPWDLNHENPQPDIRPQVVSNSWGNNDGSNEFYREMVQAWVAAGIFPVFSNGNAGPSCGSVGSPASYPESYGVGASDINDNIAFFSSRGPSPIDDGIKPDITAPGDNVRSSLPGDQYGNFSGTSMASPHVTGAIALMLSSGPSLIGDIDGIRQILDDGAVDKEDLSCDGTADDNNVWGEGRLDAFASVDLVPRGPTGSLTGAVTDAVTGEPVAGATVTVVVEGRPRATRSGPDGVYTFGAIPVGSWEATGSAAGYRPAAQTVEIVEGETTTADFALAPLPSLSGTVTDANDGLPLDGAAVTASSGETTLTATTGDDGTYFLFIDIGTWTVTFEAEGYATETGEVTASEDGEELTLDAALRSPLAAVNPGAVEAIVLSGWQRTFNIRLNNSGTSRLTWEAFESPRGAAAARVPRALEEPTPSVRRHVPAAPGPSNQRPEGYAPTASERRIQQDATALVLLDSLPWGSDGIQQVLTDNGVEFDEAGSADMGNIDLSPYEAVFIANDQPPGFYSAFEENLGWFEDYATNGGYLWLGGAAWGFGGGSPDGMPLPGGGTLHGPVFEEFNDVLVPEHPLAEGLPDPFSGSFASHASFVDHVAGTVVAVGSGSGEDTLVEYELGAGRVLLVGQTVEFGWAFGQDSGIILENGVPHAMAFQPYEDLPWLDVTPDSGGLNPGRGQRLQISIDTTGLEPGVYNAAIVLETNAARTPRVTIPVHVVVTPYLQGVNAGGDAYTDRNQDPWAADQAFDGSWGYEYASDVVSTSHAIGGTSDDALYQDARAGRLVTYRFDNLPDGVYEIELHLAEIQQRRPGERVFDVTADNTPLLVAYDIAEDAGRYQAVVHTFFVEVTDGQLRIRFVKRAGFSQPIANAVQLTHRPDLSG